MSDFPLICECGYEYFRFTNPNGRYDFVFTCERCSKQYTACGAVEFQKLCNSLHPQFSEIDE